MSDVRTHPVKKAFFTESLVRDPYPVYQRFLSQGSLHYLDRGPGPGVWGVFGYADCVALLKDRRLSAKRSGGLLLALPPEKQIEFAPLARMLGLWMLFLDPPEHSRLRKLMNKGFTPAVIESLRISIDELVEELVSPLLRAPQADLMHEVAQPLPVRVIARMLGIPESTQPQLGEWSEALSIFIGNPNRTVEQTEAAQSAVLALTSFFREIVVTRRCQKGNDLISLLLDIEADGEIFTEEELFAQCVLLLFAGHETTRNLIGNGMLVLLANPNEASRLRDNPALIRSGVEELLRYESPVQTTGRIAQEELQVCGELLPKGSIVYLMLGSANRDAQQFECPDTLDLGRLNNIHLAFGAGPHFCIGNQIARLEAQSTILRLVQQFPRMKLATEMPQWLPNFALRGLATLPVALA